jgi:leishmanolysin
MAEFCILILILILINIETILGGPCGADKLKISPKPLDLKVNKAIPITKTTADGYTPIKIGYDFTTLKRPSSMTTSTYSLVKSLLQQTRVEFSKFVQVQHTNFDLSGRADDIKELCELDTIGAGYADFLVNNDVIIFPQFDSDLGSNVLAAAAPCIVTNSNRPYGGVLYINTNLNFNKGNTNQYLKNILLHEITHILVFHPYFFTALKLNQTEGSNSYIISPKAVAKAREHFDCSSITRIPLENQGGTGSVGSHWESRYMLGDYMISTDYPDQAISDITLGLFEDSGFYKVNYYSGGLFKFGKGKGCGFMDESKKCIENEKATFEEFCDTANAAMCSSSRTLKSSCYLTTYTSSIPTAYQYFSDPRKGGFPAADYCPVPYQAHSSSTYFSNHCQIGSSSLSSEYNEKIGFDSFCFMSSILPSSSTTSTSQIPICYEVRCDADNNQFTVTIGSSEIACPTDGGTVSAPSGFTGSIVCPKYSDICLSDGSVCNEMFSCFTNLATHDNYNYQVTYGDYEGEALEDDDNIRPVRTSFSYNIKDNFALFMAICLLIYLN